MTSSVAKKRLALFASGRGSNGEALYKAMQEGYINGEFVVKGLTWFEGTCHNRSV